MLNVIVFFAGKNVRVRNRISTDILSIREMLFRSLLVLRGQSGRAD